MVLSLRIDKTAREGSRVSGRYCNLACKWCHHDYFPHDGFIAINNNDFVKIAERIISVTKTDSVNIRVAGDGEPTIVDFDDLSNLISGLRSLPKVDKIKITSNGVKLEECATQLVKAGVDSITVSLNALDSDNYVQCTGVDRLQAVLTGIDAAHSCGLKLSINAVYSSLNENQIDLYERLSCKYQIPVKFFDLIPGKDEDKIYYRSLNDLEKKFLESGVIPREQSWPYAKRIYRMSSGAVFHLKIASKINTCPNFLCHSRSICLEGCRHSIRIGLDGFMRPCGVRTDNIINMLDSNVSNEDIWQALFSGGKIGYS